MKIALLGTGRMGLPMARRLCEAGHTVSVWNRTRDKAQPLAAHGARICGTPAEAVADAQVTVGMLESGPIVQDVLFAQGAAQAMQRGSLFIDMASIQPREARDHAARLAELGVSCLDAPVSGGTVGAENGTLVIMVGGKPADFERASKCSRCSGAPRTWAPTAPASSPSWPTR
jgi:3-hydroxyisobutyrate dehydrogenase-like beta-hydroxyacid dehydrogenase